MHVAASQLDYAVLTTHVWYQRLRLLFVNHQHGGELGEGVCAQARPDLVGVGALDAHGHAERAVVVLAVDVVQVGHAVAQDAVAHAAVVARLRSAPRQDGGWDGQDTRARFTGPHAWLIWDNDRMLAAAGWSGMSPGAPTLINQQHQMV